MSFEINGKFSKALILSETLEEECMSQIITLLNHPAFTNNIAIMPDAHVGIGSVIGFTMKMGDKIIPNVVGVDIGCGVLGYEIPDDIGNIDFRILDSEIKKGIPMGTDHHKFSLISEEELNSKLKVDSPLKKIKSSPNRVYNSIGTLGGGNHFIEIGKSEKTNHYFIFIHSGSRNLGKGICEYWQKIANERMEERDNKFKKEMTDKLKAIMEKNKISKELENMKLKINKFPKELSYLEGEDLEGYLRDMFIAQEYAKLNRLVMMKIILTSLNLSFKDENSFDTIHNYISPRDKIIRKGAISSYENEKISIPLNMRDGVLICRGKSNPEWNFSAPHGAGRTMSRRKAKESINLDDFKKSMEGIYSSTVNLSTIDESPFAYKDSDMIKESLKETADIIDIVKPLYNIKASESHR